MSKLTDLISQVAASNPSLADDLRREVGRLSSRRPFGLNFERHLPETVQLPDRRVRRGDKVVFRAARDKPREHLDGRVWVVTGFEGKGSRRVAKLASRVESETPEITRLVADLVVVAEFRDPICPGLRSTGKVERGGARPYHAVINGENYHALEALTFVCKGEVDCIYIDPPYNTGARDWKYNNDYVDSEDAYRHSKWLAMMERRLRLAKNLLSPDDSVLICTIDEREVHRLAMLLEQVFAGSRIQMVSTLINPAYVARKGGFGRSDEYVIFVLIGDSAPQRVRLAREWVSGKGRTHTGNVRWDLLRRSGPGAARSDSPGCFYPIYIAPDGSSIERVGEALNPETSVPEPCDGCTAVLPIRRDGSEGRWQWTPKTLRSRADQGRVRVAGSPEKGYTISILKDGEYQKIVRGEYVMTGKHSDGSLVVADIETDEILAIPSTQWRISSHDATQYGSRLLETIIPGRRFPFPKSLYAVEDAIRFFVKDNPDAIILDFFGGSGTTTHAVLRLNRQDGGNRRSILVTNNEVSAADAKNAIKLGLRPGDPGWEAHGIHEQITRPRIVAAITGRTPDGSPVKGDYKFIDESPMSAGFEENVEFFDLTYEDHERVGHGLGFAAIAPLLWLKAGSEGARIERPCDTFKLVETYGILFGMDSSAAFVKAVRKADGLRVAYIVTDDERQFQVVAAQLPGSVESMRLYSAYLANFRIVGKD